MLSPDDPQTLQLEALQAQAQVASAGEWAAWVTQIGDTTGAIATVLVQLDSDLPSLDFAP